MTGSIAPKYLGELPTLWANARPTQPAISDRHRTRDWQAFDDAVRRTTTHLQEMGVRAGDRVAYLGHSRIEFFELLFAARRSGVAMVPLNWRLSEAELRAVLDDCTPAVTLLADEFAHTGLRAAGDVHPVVRYDEGRRAEVARCSPAPLPTSRPRRDELALLLYTSGTTGSPKGVMLTEGNFGTTGAMAAAMGFESSTVNLVVSPLFHIGGTGWALGSLWVGAHTVLVDDPSPASILSEAERHRATDLFVVPTVLRGLVDRCRSADHRTTLARIHYGASPIDASLLQDALSVLDVDVAQLYGMTETTGGLCRLAPEEHRVPSDAPHLRSCGRPFPFVEISIRDVDSGAVVPPDRVGEICVRSAQQMAGYWCNPAATAGATTLDGWTRTGDAGFLDGDGYLHICDRLKDMIITGGENVFAAEVESVLAAHPDVVEAAVIGVPDERWGEAVHAVVVAADQDAVTGTDLSTFCRDRLAHYKCPTSFTFVSSLPRNPNGKVLKRQLRGDAGAASGTTAVDPGTVSPA